MVHIRKANPEDAKSYLRVMRDTGFATYINEEAGMTLEELEKSYEGIFEPEHVQNHSNRIAASPETELRLVAEIDGNIIGIAKGRSLEPNNSFDTLYVLPEYQGMGIGYALFTKIMEFLGSSRTTELEVASYNERAISFYGRQGFSDIGKRLSRAIYEGGPEQPLTVMERLADFGK